MQTRVLLSIKPEFVAKIFSGEKRFEFRRVLFRSQRVETVVVYASSPVKRVVGEFRVGGILALSRESLWRRTRRHSGIQKDRFDDYFVGKDTAYAIMICEPQLYSQPLALDRVCGSSRPPQSFRYL